MSFQSKKGLYGVYLAIIFLICSIPIVTRSGNLSTSEITVFIILITLYCTATFFIFYNVLIPKILFKKKTFVFILTSVGYIISYTIVISLFFSLINEVFRTTFYSRFPDIMLYPFLNTLLMGVFGALARLIVNWLETKTKQQELENRSIKSELEMLRSQINPHFLFNTLNNIHSMAESDNKLTAKAIVKLSDIMRYMLYESSSEKVLLSREIDYLGSYIELINLKFKEEGFVQFNVQGDVSGKTISPLMFIPFVENAWKHCKKKTPHPGIIMNLKAANNLIHFEIENQLLETKTKQSEIGGLGLKNINRRLELLYPGKHQLNISETNDKFIVKLHIQE
jgi:two-component system LytT family sensor kinase